MCYYTDDKLSLSQGSLHPPYQPTPLGVSPSTIPSQVGLGTGAAPRPPQVMAPTPNPIGFTPVSNSGVAQRPGVAPMQPPSPQAAPIQPAVSPAAPPPTVQTADTSRVPGNLF